MMSCFSSNPSKKKLKPWKCNTALGCSYALLSAVSGAVASLCVKLVQTAEAEEILTMRWLVQYIVLLPVVTYRRQVTAGQKSSSNIAMAVRVITGAAASTLTYYNFTLMPVGDATAIMFTYIVMVGLLSFVVLREPYGLIDGLLTLMTLVGLLFIAQPSFIFASDNVDIQPNSRPLGIVLGLLSAFLVAVALVCIRKMGAAVHFSLSLFYLSLLGLIVSTIFVLTKTTLASPCLRDLFVMVLIAGFALIAIILQTMALQVQEAGPMTIVMTSQVVFAFLFEGLFLGVCPSIYSIVGAGVISFSSVCLLVLNIRRKKTKNLLENQLKNTDKSNQKNSR